MKEGYKLDTEVQGLPTLGTALKCSTYGLHHTTQEIPELHHNDSTHTFSTVEIMAIITIKDDGQHTANRNETTANLPISSPLAKLPQPWADQPLKPRE
jgi:hypothetical protein